MLPAMALALVSLSATASNWDKNDLVMDRVDQEDVMERIDRAVTSLNKLMAIPDDGIPVELMEEAVCIASIRIWNAGFGLGGKVGKGVASCRNALGEWSAPLFLKLGGLSFGLQIGAQKIDTTLVFTNDGARASLAKNNFKMSAGAGLTAGPVGRNIEAGTNFKIKDRIFAYSRAQGAYAGLTLEGVAILHDKDFNSFVYGDMGAYSILTVTQGEVPLLVRPYVNTVSKYAR